MQSKPIPSELIDYLTYNPKSGLLHWSLSPGQSITVGDVAGSLDCKGYLRLTFRGQDYKAHRVIWMIMTGKDPGQYQVDHKDRNKSNNRWDNLRLLNHFGQAFNRGALGYCWSKKMRKFKAYVQIKSKSIHLGYFECPLLARIAYYKYLVDNNLNMCTFVPIGSSILGRPDLATCAE